jgi:hypothetical protein
VAGDGFHKRRKGGRGRHAGATYSRGHLAEQARVCAGEAMDGQDDVGLDWVSGTRKGVTLTSRARSSARWRRGARTVLERGEVGLWAASLARPKASPGAIFLFFYLFSLSFSIFYFLSILLQI